MVDVIAQAFMQHLIDKLPHTTLQVSVFNKESSTHKTIIVTSIIGGLKKLSYVYIDPSKIQVVNDFGVVAGTSNYSYELSDPNSIITIVKLLRQSHPKPPVPRKKRKKRRSKR